MENGEWRMENGERRDKEVEYISAQTRTPNYILTRYIITH